MQSPAAAPGIKSRSPVHVQHADHYTMAEEKGLWNTHPLWKFMADSKYCNFGFIPQDFMTKSKAAGNQLFVLPNSFNAKGPLPQNIIVLNFFHN